MTTGDLAGYRGRDALDSDGEKIGSIDEIYEDTETGKPEWMAVKTGLFGSNVSFVPLADASEAPDGIRVPYSKEQVKNAPNADPDRELSQEEEARLYGHYGLPYSERSSDSGLPDQSAGDVSGTSATTSGRAGGGDAAFDRDSESVSGTSATTAGRVGGGDAGFDRDSERVSGTSATAGGAGGGDAGFDRDAGTMSDTTTTAGAAGRADPTPQGSPGVVGNDVSGPETDDAMTLSGEELRVDTERREAGRARLRKYIVTEDVEKTVPVQREEVRVEREPITDANIDQAMSGPELTEAEHEVVLHEEAPVVEKEVVPQERVRLDKDVTQEEQRVSDTVRKEQVDVDGDEDRRL